MGDTYANTKALGLILNLIFKSPNCSLEQSEKLQNSSMSSSGIDDLKRIGIMQGMDTQSLIASSISLFVTCSTC
ncbi:MAG: hypothetical protein EZS28_025013 [Streblomastix strix]|uniref:Uncharacterized protein n=1 Tax=Streblomastix strix TaxID=222440 RepID=A0A5J4VAE2_9EUKA|nr:MAG: hypothetical protein EZS28_025013 [Streblomastix strix]